MNSNVSQAHQRSSVIKMANDIARNIVLDGCCSKSEAIARHIRRYWPQSMQKLLQEEVSAGNATLHPDLPAATDLIADPD